MSLGIGRKNKSSKVSQSSYALKSTTAIDSLANSSPEIESTPSYIAESEKNKPLSTSSNNSIHEPVEPINPPNSTKNKHASWYNPQEHAAMKAEVTDNLRIQREIKTSQSKPSRTTGINDNFVRLDLRNSSGSCRGARNLKKVNKQKAWRAKHRFGKSDDGAETMDSDNPHPKKQWKKSKSQVNESSFASKRNGGVDPLDDFLDGMFHNAKSGKECGVACTRHGRPCKLMTVKRNNKGNKGRKFYVCSMPMGEKCDFFKWEEDTMEVSGDIFAFYICLYCNA
jgi:hypothetical protein